MEHVVLRSPMFLLSKSWSDALIQVARVIIVIVSDHCVSVVSVSGF